MLLSQKRALLSGRPLRSTPSEIGSSRKRWGSCPRPGGRSQWSASLSGAPLLPCTPVPGPQVSRAAAARLEGGGDVLRQIPGSGESARGSLLTNPNPGSFVFSSWEFRVCPGRLVRTGGRPGDSSQLHLGTVFSSGQPWDFNFSIFKMGVN